MGTESHPGTDDGDTGVRLGYERGATTFANRRLPFGEVTVGSLERGIRAANSREPGGRQRLVTLFLLSLLAAPLRIAMYLHPTSRAVTARLKDEAGRLKGLSVEDASGHEVDLLREENVGNRLLVYFSPEGPTCRKLRKTLLQREAPCPAS